MKTDQQAGASTGLSPVGLSPVVRALVAFSMVLGTALSTVAGPILAQGACGATVTVVRGDTLREIANRCNTTVNALLAVNPQIVNRNLIRVGQVITIPGGAQPAPDDAAVTIEPNNGPPGSDLTITGRDFPANTELIVGLGAPASEPVVTVRTTTGADGQFTTQLTIANNAQPNERLVVVAYVPGQGGARATSQEFTVTDGQPGATVTVTPQQAPAAATVQLQATGFAPNTPVEIGFGEVESEYNVIAQATTDGNGDLTRDLQVPSYAQPNEQYLFVVTPAGASAETTSNTFTVTDNGQELNPQVSISPRSGSPGTNLQLAVRGFPAYTRLTYGIGVPEGQLLNTYSTRTNHRGAAQLTLQIPEVDPGTNLEVTAFVPQPGGANAMSDLFHVTARDDDGTNLFTRTNIYLIALEDGGQRGMAIGCGDGLVPVEISIEPTIAPLSAAMRTLLGIDERYYGQSGLYNALAPSTLAVERVDIVNGVASIYLTGELQVGGVCDEPRVRAQIEETALQYYTVNEVQIYVNGEPLAF